MENILLVVPKENTPIVGWEVLPIGIMYVSSSMKKAGLSVFILNLTGEKEDTFKLVQEAILKHSIHIVATGGLVVNHKEMKDVIDSVKATRSDIVTIIGGGLVSHSPYEAMEIIDTADYGVIGEGEITDVELIKAIQNKTRIEDVKGIIFRKNGQLCLTEEREDIEDLDAIPWPDYEGFQYFEILKQVSSQIALSAPLTTSRSCPFQCTFCTNSGGKNIDKEV